MRRRAGGWAAAAVSAATLAACGQDEAGPSVRRDLAASAAPATTAEETLRAAATAHADAVARADVARLAGFPSPRCTEDERQRIAAAAALPAEIVGDGRVLVEFVRVDGVFGSVSYAFAGPFADGFREAFETVDAEIDHWELVDGTWYTVDAQACAGDAAAARTRPPTASPPPPAGAGGPDLAEAWSLEGVDVHDGGHGVFAGTLTLTHLDPGLPDADFTLTLYAGETQVGVLTGSARGAGGGPLTVELTSTDPFVAGPVGYDFAVRAPS